MPGLSHVLSTGAVLRCSEARNKQRHRGAWPNAPAASLGRAEVVSLIYGLICAARTSMSAFLPTPLAMVVRKTFRLDVLASRIRRS
jgi:hypothetical protein